MIVKPQTMKAFTHFKLGNKVYDPATKQDYIVTRGPKISQSKSTITVGLNGESWTWGVDEAGIHGPIIPTPVTE